MKRRVLAILTILITTISSFGQFSEQKITTDSSDINIIKNSVYHIYEETLKKKDSIWYSVHFIKDTTRLNTEGWKRKNGSRLGIWKEYNFKKQLLYTWDYKKGICEVNKSLYPYYDILEKMKLKADSLIISTYSQEFYNTHIKFEYDCYAYHGHRVTTGKETVWTYDYLGSWTEPMKGEPNSFKFRYKVRLKKFDEEGIELGFDLDSVGNYVPSEDDFWNNYGFEDVKVGRKIFKIDIDKATVIAKQHGLILTDSTSISELLIWENFKKQTFFNGQFRYYFTNLISTTEYTKVPERKGIIYRYDVYSFNPWTGEFVEKKKMKSIHEWSSYSGHRTGLLPDND